MKNPKIVKLNMEILVGFLKIYFVCIYLYINMLCVVCDMWVDVIVLVFV